MAKTSTQVVQRTAGLYNALGVRAPSLTGIEKRRYLLDRVQKGASVSRAARLIGVTDETVRNWCKKDPVFAAQLDRARHARRALPCREKALKPRQVRLLVEWGECRTAAEAMAKVKVPWGTWNSWYMNSAKFNRAWKGISSTRTRVYHKPVTNGRRFIRCRPHPTGLRPH